MAPVGLSWARSIPAATRWLRMHVRIEPFPASLIVLIDRSIRTGRMQVGPLQTCATPEAIVPWRGSERCATSGGIRQSSRWTCHLSRLLARLSPVAARPSHGGHGAATSVSSISGNSVHRCAGTRVK